MTSGRARLAARRATADAFDRRLIAPMILGAVLNPVNSSIIAVSLVPIGRAFGAPVSQTAWLVSGLYLATAIGQPVVGRLVETYGPRRLYLAAAALVGVAGVLGTVATSLPMLVLARVILGFGTCAGYPAAMFLIRSEARRTRQDSPATILTILSIATQTIAVIGPTLGGLLIGVGGWRLTLAVNIPLSVVALALGVLRLPRAAEALGGVKPPPARHLVAELDVLGMALFAAMLTSLLLFLMEPEVDTAFLPVVTVVAGWWFAVRERRLEVPFIDLRVLGGNRPLVATYARVILTGIVGYCFIYGFTQWLQDGRGLTPSEVGLVLLPMFGTGIVVSAATGRHPQIRGKLLVGGVGQVASIVVLLLSTPSTPVFVFVGAGVLMGIPQGLNNLANQNALYHQADPARIGSSAGLLRTFTYLGAIASSTASGAFFGTTATTSGLHDLAVFMLVAAAAFLALAALDPALRLVGAPDIDDAASSDSPASPSSSASVRSTK